MSIIYFAYKHHWTYLLWFCFLPFHFADDSLHCGEDFSFDLIFFVYFCFCCPWLKRQITKIIAKTDVRVYCLCVLLEVLWFYVLHLSLQFILNLFLYIVWESRSVWFYGADYSGCTGGQGWLPPAAAVHSGQMLALFFSLYNLKYEARMFSICLSKLS